MKYLIIIHLALTSSLVYSGSLGSCKQLTQELLTFGEVRNISVLKEFGIYKPSAVETKVFRYGSPIPFKMPGKLQGVFEVDILKLKSLHPIPNPLREGSAQKLKELVETIEDEGYNIKFPVQVALLRNGTLRIVGGHHRVRAMQLLGESHVPAQIFIWDAMRKDTRQMYRDEIINKLSKVFPEYYQELTELPQLFD